MITKVTISEDALFQEVSGELVILDLATEQYYGLNAVGSRIWLLLKEGKSVEDAKSCLLDEYDIGIPQLDADITELLNELSAKGLATVERC